MPALNSLATKLYDRTHTYCEMVHFVHIYVIEPHPMSPDPSPYSGSVWPGSYSTKRQPKTYCERVANALDVEPLLTGYQRLLIDDLRPNGPDNPLWCTYGTNPNCAYLIAMDGTIDKVQLWVDTTDMETAIKDLLVRTKAIPTNSILSIITLLIGFTFFIRISNQ
ncbi:MAG: hypothetical protein A2161_20680 [Candidatus Schekmanbacteria bacterium RBG_13_48_7]|uniref:Uncharacterized protein n=1 Tax=Candidatus Schekmanbacteria bacterium RBG_13_48_7 TaxID=1817878 RepID=A0A1F7RMA7_9BACT|nr:MAG: hypothetical protein A2161_20680 [Candidatus Schekmanbacteria bacterium RBG_13_48_7]